MPPRSPKRWSDRKAEWPLSSATCVSLIDNGMSPVPASWESRRYATAEKFNLPLPASETCETCWMSDMPFCNQATQHSRAVPASACSTAFEAAPAPGHDAPAPGHDEDAASFAASEAASAPGHDAPAPGHDAPAPKSWCSAQWCDARVCAHGCCHFIADKICQCCAPSIFSGVSTSSTTIATSPGRHKF